jgi:hypothetical protein
MSESTGAPAEDTAASDTPAPAGSTFDPAEKTRAWTGLLVVVVGDVAIALGGIVGVAYTASHAASSSTMVAILTAAFTAISTMTTAYFGIRSMSNTAQASISSSNS